MLRGRRKDFCRFVKSSLEFSTSPKEARRIRMKGTQGQKLDSKFYYAVGGTVVVAGLAAFGISNIRSNPTGSLGKLYFGSPLESVINYIYDCTWGQFRQILEPVSDKLLPEWGVDPFYGNNIPPGTPAPPLLVLDLEKTIMGSEHSAKYGWRHVKRPGLDKFLEQLRQYYEIVIFSENDVNSQQELLLEIDKDNCTFKLGPSAAELKGTTLMKRLDVLNRDERRIIVIDDDEQAVQLCPRNALIVKPYTNVRDKGDRILLDLIPLLQALVQENVRDIRDTLDGLGTRDAHEAAIEYQMRVAKRIDQEDARRNRGLGGLLRQNMPMPDVDEVLQSQRISPDLVFGMDAKAPGLRHKNNNTTTATGERIEDVPVVKKKGALWQAHEEREKAHKEDMERKAMAMQEEYTKRMMKKAEDEKKQEKRNLM
eukprot:gene3973-7916_t